MMDKEELKATREREIFVHFCKSADLPLDVESLKSRRPPYPDIEFSLSGEYAFAELVEIADPAIARMLDDIRKTDRGVLGTGFSSLTPLVKAFTDKFDGSYETEGKPLLLLAYYDKQYAQTPFGPNFIQDTIGTIAEKMIRPGNWNQIWIYDHWHKKVLWKKFR